MTESVIVKMIETADGKYYDVEFRDSSTGDSVNERQRHRHHHHRRSGSRRITEQRSSSRRINLNDEHYDERRSSSGRSRRHHSSSSIISDHTGGATARRHSRHRRDHQSNRNKKHHHSSDDVSSLASSKQSHHHHKHKRRSSSHRAFKARRPTKKEDSHRDNNRRRYSSKSLTTASSSSTGESNIWDNSRHNGRTMEVLNGFAWVQEEGEEVEYQPLPKRNNKGYFQRIPIKCKMVLLSLMASLFAFAFFLTLKVIINSNKTTSHSVSSENADSTTIVSTEEPAKIPTKAPTRTPYPLATRDPTPRPTTSAPTVETTSSPTQVTNAPTEPVVATYIPGKLTVKSNGLLLSEGLSSRIVATSGKPVILTSRNNSQQQQQQQENNNTTTSAVSLIDFHKEPDGAAIFPWFETGGWVYVSNSEVKDKGKGGVGAIYFDKDGNVLDYQNLLDGTTMNCGGGPTPWGTWVSCEEIDGGKAFQVDPFGIRPSQQLSTLGTGFFEAFAYDVRNPQEPAFYVTEDKERGPLRRIIPANPDWDDPWEILHGFGRLEYLVLEPNVENNGKNGSFYWTTERETAKVNSQKYYKHSEGIDVHHDQLFFVSKVQKELFILNLDLFTYEVHATVSGVFDGQPDQMKRLIRNGLLYFCEEGGKENGVHARDENGWFFTILESETLSDETTGLAFSPDGMHMYVSYQHNGLIFDVWRDDKLPFHARTLNVKYHEIQ